MPLVVADSAAMEREIAVESRKETLHPKKPQRRLEGLFMVSLSSNGSDRQGTIEEIRDQMIREFESTLRSDRGMAILEAVVDAGSLEDRERALLRLRAAAFPRVAQVAFGETGYAGTRLPCTCGRRMRHVHNGGKTFVTLVGEMRIDRAKYRCTACGRVLRPLDERWSLPAGRYSAGVHRVASMLGASMPFARAGAFLEEMTGVGVSARHVEELTEAVGAAIGEGLSREAVAAARGDSEPAPECDVLVVALDGGMINTREQGWKEVKLGAVQSLHRVDDKTLARGHTSYAAHLGSVEPFRDLVWAEVSRREEQGREATVVLGDGAPWIWNVADEILSGAVQILDWYHLSEHVHETKRLVFEGREKSGQRWAERILGHLWNERVDQALRSIRRTRTVTKPHQEALGDLCRYIDVNRRRMGYRTLHSLGYPVGSGVVESGIKQVVQQRHKQAGMRWSQGHAQKMLNVSACLRSDRWDEFWAARRVAA